MTMNSIIKQSNSFKKTVKKLPKQHKVILDEEIRKLINNPELGERKKGDLDFLRVHKFKLLNQEVLLGYIPKKLGNAIFDLLLFPLMALKKDSP